MSEATLLFRPTFLYLQVQKVLRNLVLEGCLEQEHIALLWDLTEKVSVC